MYAWTEEAEQTQTGNGQRPRSPAGSWRRQVEHIREATKVTPPPSRKDHPGLPPRVLSHGMQRALRTGGREEERGQVEEQRRQSEMRSSLQLASELRQAEGALATLDAAHAQLGGDEPEWLSMAELALRDDTACTSPDTATARGASDLDESTDGMLARPAEEFEADSMAMLQHAERLMTEAAKAVRGREQKKRIKYASRKIETATKWLIEIVSESTSPRGSSAITKRRHSQAAKPHAPPSSGARSYLGAAPRGQAGQPARGESRPRDGRAPTTPLRAHRWVSEASPSSGRSTSMAAAATSASAVVPATASTATTTAMFD
uniref:Uncharacterized protein n=1 Tax=Coccolithus braarudii TaxID=221442 RepID=A0A7S0Q7L6_9EUKA|mmetsp:Transcript_50477/g.107787  ORF Transcript_50477/g.107787 Transcript_50477/m.107787 type:complete len:319 (+) Transcript_50477:254-1210(+)